MSKTILCVDDSVTMQTVCEITFRASDYEYVGARSAAEAMQKARASKPALVLADAVMPDSNGYDLCKELKAELSGVPVYILCGNSQAYDEAKGAAAGADGSVSKPWDTTKLLEQVAEYLAKAESGVAAPGAAAAAPTPPAPTPPAPTPPAPTPAPPPAAAAPIPAPPKPAPAPMAAAPTPAPPKPAPAPAPIPRHARPTPTGEPEVPSPPPGMTRPPMIKGVPTKRPATPISPPGRAAAVAAAAAKPVTPAPPRSATLMGMQALEMPPPSRATPKPPGVTSISSKRPAMPPPAVDQVAARVQEVMPAAAESAARSAGLDPAGPEMQAIVKLSREVIEQVVWEVVPDLAETIIRENLDRLTAK